MVQPRYPIDILCPLKFRRSCPTVCPLWLLENSHAPTLSKNTSLAPSASAIIRVELAISSHRIAFHTPSFLFSNSSIGYLRNDHPGSGTARDAASERCWTAHRIPTSYLDDPLFLGNILSQGFSFWQKGLTPSSLENGFDLFVSV